MLDSGFLTSHLGFITTSLTLRNSLDLITLSFFICNLRIMMWPLTFENCCENELINACKALRKMSHSKYLIDVSYYYHCYQDDSHISDTDCLFSSPVTLLLMLFTPTPHVNNFAQPSRLGTPVDSSTIFPQFITQSIILQKRLVAYPKFCHVLLIF